MSHPDFQKSIHVLRIEDIFEKSKIKKNKWLDLINKENRLQEKYRKRDRRITYIGKTLKTEDEDADHASRGTADMRREQAVDNDDITLEAEEEHSYIEEEMDQVELDLDEDNEEQDSDILSDL
ncbi:hypothetical protein O9G_003002 [Rozella allomycis CSF55]|uniref:Uncharacterized protein n=1 Tax=Rozella allomycis (strain CSF55) TaxID=988480 RepID=A0A075AZZ8_ROZAC|nr:hypothetical protein O9G_003002 [Rozella allomycis CSF55]|eukprot:EPZ34282.1 hypothetical protein O9G_003002 [Rozella allomycis CSF55]